MWNKKQKCIYVMEYALDIEFNKKILFKTTRFILLFMYIIKIVLKRITKCKQGVYIMFI